MCTDVYVSSFFLIMPKYRVHPIDLLVETFVLYQLLVANELTRIAICDSIAWGLVYFAIRCIRHRYAWTKRWFIGTIISYGIIQSFLAFLQIAGVIPTNHALFATTGSFSNPGPLGGCLAICLIITFSIWKNSNNERIGRLLLCSVLFMGTACIMTDSRAAWISREELGKKNRTLCEIFRFAQNDIESSE